MRGHQVEVLDTLKCYMDITATKPSMWYRGRQLRDIDAVIPRIGASITTYGASVIRQFEMMGIYCLTDSIALTRSRDKLRALQMLSRKGIDMPRTGFAHSINNAKQLMGLVGGAPVVVKLCSGTQGKGVVLAETPKAAESVIDAFLELKADFLVQEYIKEAGGSDIRCMVIGNKVVSAIERTAAAGEFTYEFEELRHEGEAAVAAAKAIGLNVSGVDLLRSDRGALVMEVNSSPGLEGIETATRKDVAGKIVEFIEFNARPYTKRGRRG